MRKGMSTRKAPGTWAGSPEFRMTSMSALPVIFAAVWMITLSFILSGCVQDPTSVTPVVPVPSAKGVYILNEGTFGRGNASLSYYDLESFRAYNDVFFAVNNRNLGDVANQMVVRGNRGFLVINNSDKVEVIDLHSNASVGTINVGSGKSPRQIAFAGDTLALVTALYDNSVLLVNTLTFTVTGRIAVGDNPEGIAIANGKAYVANSGFGYGRTLSVIDIASRAVSRTITVGDNPTGVGLSGEGEVFVVCGGAYNDFANPDDDTPAKLAIVSPISDTVVDTILLGEHATTIALSPEGRGYVPLTTKVLSIDTRGRRVVGTFAPKSFYGVGIEEVSGDIYLTDPKDFVQAGEVYIYAANGQLRNRIQVGVIPGSIAFKR
jgi:YVTN family beta-propeller protein